MLTLLKLVISSSAELAGEWRISRQAAHKRRMLLLRKELEESEMELRVLNRLVEHYHLKWHTAKGGLKRLYFELLTATETKRFALKDLMEKAQKILNLD